MTTAYATWDFNGKPGVKDLAGLVYIDGGSLGGAPPTPEDAQASLDKLNQPDQSPFLDLLGLGVPWAAGVFNAVGSTAAREAPNELSVFDGYPLLPASLKPPVPATNAGGYGYGLDADTSPASLALVHVHIGHLADSGIPAGGPTASSEPSSAPPRFSPASRGWTGPRGITRGASRSTRPRSTTASTIRPRPCSTIMRPTATT
jgi:hypothetical protein